MPAAAASGAIGVEMLAREDFGRRHQRGLAAAFDHGGRREQRDHGLAGADVALQQRSMRSGFARSATISVDRARLRRRQRIGQGLDQLLAQMAGAGGGAAGGRRRWVRTSASASWPASSSS